MRGLKMSLMAAALLLPASPPGTAHAAANAERIQAERIQVKGEIIDTWCYFSGVMGGPDAVVGSAHHTCALWCAAGGIPVGLLAEDGTVYMVLKYKGDDNATGSDRVLEIQSDEITADGLLYRRDGVNYLVVEDVVANDGITNRSHEDFDIIPRFAIPKPKKQ